MQIHHLQGHIQSVYLVEYPDKLLSVFHLPSHRVYVADLMVKVQNRFRPRFPVFHPNKYGRPIQQIMNLQPSSILLAHGGEVRLSNEDYHCLIHSSPAMPKTPLRAIKLKIKQILRRRSR